MNRTFQLNDERIGSIAAAARTLLHDPGIMLEDEKIYQTLAIPFLLAPRGGRR